MPFRASVNIIVSHQLLQRHDTRYVEMVSKCANPDCGASFLRFNKGQLFCIESMQKHGAVAEYVWLCPKCSTSMTVTRSVNGQYRLSLAAAKQKAESPLRRSA